MMDVKFFKCAICGLIHMGTDEGIPYEWAVLDRDDPEEHKALCPVCAEAILDEIEVFKTYMESDRTRYSDEVWATKRG